MPLLTSLTIRFLLPVSLGILLALPAIGEEEGIPILKEPSAGAEVIDTAKKGRKVRILDQTDDGYTHIQFKDSFNIIQDGWVESHRLKAKKKPVNEDPSQQVKSSRGGSRLNEGSLVAADRLTLGDWAISYQPRRWRPMLALEAIFSRVSKQFDSDTQTLGSGQSSSFRIVPTIGFGLGRRLAIAATQPFVAKTEKTSLLGEDRSFSTSDWAETEFRLTSLVFGREAAKNFQIGALYSPGKRPTYTQDGDPKTTTRGQSLTGLLISYWSLSPDGGWLAGVDLRHLGEGVDVPTQGELIKASNELAAFAVYRFHDSGFTIDVGYRATLATEQTRVAADGDKTKIKTDSVHRLFSQARYPFSAATALLVSLSFDLGGRIFFTDDSTAIRPNVGTQGGTGLIHNF